MKSFTVGEFKALFAAVLKEVQAGHPIAITYGKKRQTLAVLVPYNQYVRTTQRQLGVLQDEANYHRGILVNMMNCLLDTHTFLWAAMSPQRLSQDAQERRKMPPPFTSCRDSNTKTRSTACSSGKPYARI